jgi:hypothetical protein
VRRAGAGDVCIGLIALMRHLCCELALMRRRSLK